VFLLAAAALASALAAFRPYQETGGVPIWGADWKSRYNQRFAGLPAALPATRMFGYLCETPPGKLDGWDIERMYYVQYLIFPNLMEGTADYEWVIVNFDFGHFQDRHLSAAEKADPRKATEAFLRLRRERLKQQHLVLKTDFGDGVLLCRREGVGGHKR